MSDEGSVSSLSASCLLLLPPASCLLPPASCLLPPASCLLPPASCLLPPASCLLPPASCLLPPVRGGPLGSPPIGPLRSGTAEVVWKQERGARHERNRLPYLHPLRSGLRARLRGRWRPDRRGAPGRRRRLLARLRLPEGRRDRRGARRSRPAAPADAPHARPAASSRSPGTTRSISVARAPERDPRRATARDAVAIYFGNPIVHNHGALAAAPGPAERARHAQLHQRRLAGHQPALRRLVLSLRQLVVDPGPRRRSHRLLPLHRRQPARLATAASSRAPNMRARLRAHPRSAAARSWSSIRAAPRRRARPTSTSPSAPAATPRFLLAMVQRAGRARARRPRRDRRAATGWDEIERAPARAHARARRRASPACRPRRSSAWRSSSPTRRPRSPTRASASATTPSARSRRYATDLLNVAAGRLGAVGGAMFTDARPSTSRGFTRMAGIDGHDRWRSRVRGLPETLGDLPAAVLAEEIETPGPRPGARAGHLRRQPGAVDAERAPPRRGARQARVHGLDRSLRQRDDAPRRRHPAAGVEPDRRPRRRAASRRCRAQRRALVAAGGRAAGRRARRLGDPARARPSVSAAARPARPMRRSRAALSPSASAIAGNPIRFVDLLLRTGPHGDRFLPWQHAAST